MKTLLIRLIVGTAFLVPFGIEGQVVSTGGNPLFPGADPDITISNGKYWVYPTTQTGFKMSEKFFVYSSPDLRTWTKGGPVLSAENIPWIGDDGEPKHYLWAPGIFQHGGKFYFYYAVGPQGKTPSRIGVAVGTSPDGRFIDSGKPLLTGGHGFEAIDPMVFGDQKSGKAYLYAGGSAGSTLRVFELNPDLVSIAREVPVATPPHFTEGVYMTERNGIYYLSYSHGKWFNKTYGVHYCTAPSPLGPWTYKGPILTSTAKDWGPGHHAFFQNPTTGQWYIVYHRWNNVVDGKKPPYRSVCIDLLEFDANGNILPVKMTDTGVAPSPP